jgi:serine protease Do
MEPSDALRRHRLLLAAVCAAILLAPNIAAAPPGWKLTVQDAPVARDTHPATSFAPIAKRVSPNVVNIFTTRKARSFPRLDEPLSQFFGPRQGDGSVPRQRREQSLGSGVILTADGYIATNNHVVAAADTVKVVLPDGKEFTAKVIGTDPHTDLAVVKIDGKTLPAVTVTDSDNVEVGDVVLAVGNPFGVGQTVTSGIVSAKSRGGMGIVDYEDFIQTDASINPGNSGGALIDAEGRLIGINTAILSRTGGNQGVGFAVPVNLLRNVMDQLITTGKVTRGYLGVVIQPVTPDLAQEFQLPDATGALVSEVTPGSPGARAGLKEGDVITEFNGKKVADNRQLRFLAAQTAPGAKVPIKVLRDGKEQWLTVELGELKNERLANGSMPNSPVEPEPSADLLDGVTVADLDAGTRQQFNIPDDVKGAVVVEVDPDSPAAAAGLQPGDVIVEANRKAATTAREAIRATNEGTGDRVLLRVWSRGAVRYVTVEKGKEK